MRDAGLEKTEGADASDVTLYQSARSKNFRYILPSILVHCGLLIVLLRPPHPTVVRVQQLRQGSGGHSLVRLYWPAASATGIGSADEPSSKRKDVPRSKKLEDPSKSLQLRLERHQRLLAQSGGERSSHASAASSAPTAGSANGTFAEGDLTGPDVRPALWISGPNPALAADDFAHGLEGSVIVEITIDDQGNVVDTVLIQGLSDAVDERVLAALKMAHFIPAQRNGISIPSKQDVYYHFPH